MENIVVYKYLGKEEQRKQFPDAISAFRFQAGLVKSKKNLEYATVK